MRIAIVTHAPRGARNGNRITALRWAGILRGLKHRVSLGATLPDDPIDVLIALHGYHSHAAIVACRGRWPRAKILVVMTGTDLYVDLTGAGARSEAVKDSFEIADRILGLHAGVMDALDSRLRGKTRVILQSASPPSQVPERNDHAFEVVAVGHLREVKNPLLAVRAVGELPEDSRVLISQVGESLEPELTRAVSAADRGQPNYRWLGKMTRKETIARIAAARALLITSDAEGGSNVLTEAVVCGTPVISTRIDAAIHLLGEDYEGLFPRNDAPSLAELLLRAERDPGFLAGLTRRCTEAAAQFAPEREC